MSGDDWGVLKIFPDDLSAQLVASELRAEGIESQIFTDDAGGAIPALQMTQGVRLFVKQEDWKRACEVLAAVELEIQPETKPAPIKEGTPPASRIESWVMHVLFFLIGIVVAFSISGIAFFYHLRHEHRYSGVVYHDHDGNGINDEIAHYKRGTLITVERDRNQDGRMDAWFYYQRGFVVHAEADDDFDGRTDVWRTFDPFGNLLEQKQDVDGDGKADVIWKTRFDVLYEAVWFAKNSDTIQKKQVFAQGIKREEWIDENGDGEFDLKIFFDNRENEIRRERLK